MFLRESVCCKVHHSIRDAVIVAIEKNGWKTPSGEVDISQGEYLHFYPRERVYQFLNNQIKKTQISIEEALELKTNKVLTLKDLKPGDEFRTHGRGICGKVIAARSNGWKIVGLDGDEALFAWIQDNKIRAIDGDTRDFFDEEVERL